MKANKILSGFDKTIGAKYELLKFESAKELAEALKKEYKTKGINIDLFNSVKGKDKDFMDDYDTAVESNPPREIYEYQNFFLLQNKIGEYTLLDGFRRLLWYKAPETEIFVRVYKQDELSNTQILSLLIFLNHFKFFVDDSSYHERGFSLLLNSVFGLNITKFKNTFDAYLSSENLKNNYWNSGSEGVAKNETVKERILNPNFISDIRFIEELNSDGSFMIDSFFGALVYSERQKTKKDFVSADFIKHTKGNKVLADLMVKYKKVGTNSSAKSQEVVNQIMDIYKNIFVLMAGGKIEKAYAEKVKDCKDLAAQIAKDKNFTKLTGAKEIRDIEEEMEKRLKKGIKMKFKCVVFPQEENDFLNESEDDKKYPILECGTREDVEFLEMIRKNAAFSKEEMLFGLKIGKNIFKVNHSFSNWNGPAAKKNTYT